MTLRLAICGAVIWLGSTLLLPSVGSAAPWETTPKELENLGVDEHVGETLPLDLVFRDHARHDARLGAAFTGDRPVIVSMNYSNCPMLCNLQLSGLITALQRLEWSVGKEFDVVSVSIDPSETPERAGQTRQKFMDIYERPGTANGWKFLVGDKPSIDRLAGAIGLNYRYVPDRREYAHPAVLVLCTPDGKIARYMYGVDFPVETMKLSLTEVGEGKVGGVWDQILLFCFHYDAEKGRYAPAARNIMKVAGVVTVLIIIAGIGILLRREQRRIGFRTPAGPLAT